MSNKTIFLDHQYQNIEAAINTSVSSLNELFEDYREQLNHYLLLSELAEMFIRSGTEISVIDLATFIIDFELSRFEPVGYLPQPFAENKFIGEILYASESLALCRIESIKYSNIEVVITITKETLSLGFPFHSNNGFDAKYSLRINGVMSV